MAHPWNSEVEKDPYVFFKQREGTEFNDGTEGRKGFVDSNGNFLGTIS